MDDTAMPWGSYFFCVKSCLVRLSARPTELGFG